MEMVAIGRLRKPFGVDGRLRYEIDSRYEHDLSTADVLFLQRPDGQVPYFVEEIVYGEPPTIKLEDIDSKEAASTLSMSMVSLRAADISVTAEPTDESGLAKLAGFLLTDKEQEVGRISDVREYPQQLMAVIQIEEVEVLIPLVADLILDIDIDQRIVHCDLPEGLVEAQMP